MSAAAADRLISFGSFEFDPDSGLLFSGEDETLLPPKVAAVLLVLVNRAGEMVAKDELLESVWAGSFVTESSLTDAVSVLRHALGDDPQKSSYIQTIHRRGYRFIAEVEVGRAPKDAFGPTIGDGPDQQGRGIPRTAAAAIAVVAVITGALLTSVVTRRNAPAPEGVQSVIPVEPFHRLFGGTVMEVAPPGFQRPSRTAMALSPDGRHLVYAATDGETSHLYRRPVDQQVATSLVQGDVCCPFFSPDGRTVGYFGREGEASVSNLGSTAQLEELWGPWDLMSVPLEGSEEQTLAEKAVPGMPFGATWGDDDTIVFAEGREGGLLRVPANGGTLERLTTVDREKGEYSHRLPHMLPGSNAVLFTITTGNYSWNESEIVVQSLETGEKTVLARPGTDPRYVATGHLLFAREGTAMAVPFDRGRLEVDGEPVRVLEDVMHAEWSEHWALEVGAAQLSVSETGDLVYVPGGTYPLFLQSLAWVDRQEGSVDRDADYDILRTPPGRGFWPRVSPDGRYIVYMSGPLYDLALFIYDIETGTSKRLTVEEEVGPSCPVWSPDGKRIAYSARTHGGIRNLYVRAADGTGETTRLTRCDRAQWASSWSRDDVLAFVQEEEGLDRDIWILPMEGEDPGVPRAFLDDPHGKGWPAFSPDGNWLAYSSNETGRVEVYVRPYPGPGAAEVVSTAGGTAAAWSRNRQELFYVEDWRGLLDPNVPQEVVMKFVEYDADGSFKPGRPAPLLKGFFRATYRVRNYDVTPEGRFLMIVQGHNPPRPVTRINLWQNWFQELERRVPTGWRP